MIAIAPACMIATSAFGWTFPFGSGVRVQGEGLAGASGGARSTAIDLIEKGAQAATLISGPLDDDQIVEAITRGGPVESICMAEGLHSTAVRATTIKCVYILIGDYVGDHQDQAILSAGPPPDPSSDPIAAAFGVPSKPAYLVSIPGGTVRTLLSLIRPNPYPGDGFALYFPTGGGTLSGEDLAASVWPRIDVALPAAILVSGPLSSTEVDALIDNEAPGLEWILGGRPTMLPVPAPGQRVYAVLVLGGSTDWGCGRDLRPEGWSALLVSAGPFAGWPRAAGLHTRRIISPLRQGSVHGELTWRQRLSRANPRLVQHTRPRRRRRSRSGPDTIPARSDALPWAHSKFERPFEALPAVRR